MIRLAPLFSILVLQSISFFGFCQYHQYPELSQTYFNYRQRLHDRFLLCIGREAGCSVPASQRNTHDEHYRGQSTIKWGDGTIFLAHYISVLASEYKLLDRQSDKQAETLAELYFAIEAFNRLDFYADTCWGYPPALNGFFIRSDAGAGLAGDSVRTRKALSKLNRYGPPVNNLNSEFLNFLKSDTQRFAVSKDQVFHLLMAMKLIAFCIPDSVKSEHPFSDNEYHFAREAGNITERMLNWIHPPDYSNFPTNWTVRLPNGRSVRAGSNAWTYAVPLSLIQKDISGTSNPAKRGLSFLMAGFVYQLSWSCFRPIFFFNRSEGFKTLLLESLAGKRKDKLKRIIRLSHAFPPYEWVFIPLLYDLLNPSSKEKTDPSFYLDILRSVPPDGPFHFDESNRSGPWWSTPSLIHHPAGRQQSPPHFPGYYNGLDFMLFYNLFLLVNSRN